MNDEESVPCAKVMVSFHHLVDIVQCPPFVQVELADCVSP
jgi:hypothetical protein